VLGYVDLQGSFQPGPLLRAADQAMRERDRFHLCIVDEMNLARVEHYFAEVLSCMEGRTVSAEGRLESAALLSLALSDRDARWRTVRIPSNLAIVGTVNMDESAHGFSRKVLDRAFTLELSDVDLRQWGHVAAGGGAATIDWPVDTWTARSADLAARAASGPDRTTIEKVVEVLVDVNAILVQAQLQVGYRTRDEVALFVLNAAAVAASFVTRDGAGVDPLDLALLMKILPRVAGGSAPVRQVVLGLLGFATDGKVLDNEQTAEEVVSAWRRASRPAEIVGAQFPRTAARLCVMWDRLVTEGFTSFWL
jgi:5-methylcytosine-specific restriction protein B